MPWISLLTTLLPIVLAPSHPNAAEAHTVLVDAHALASGPLTSTNPPQDHNERLVGILTRALDLSMKARAISGAPGDATTDALSSALAALVGPQAVK